MRTSTVQSAHQPDSILGQEPGDIGIVVAIQVVVQAGLVVAVLALETQQYGRDTFGSAFGPQTPPAAILALPDRAAVRVGQLSGTPT